MLELGNLDMILELVWLQKSGKVTFDWKDMTINFCCNGEQVELQGQRPRGCNKKEKKQIAK